MGVAAFKGFKTVTLTLDVARDEMDATEPKFCETEGVTLKFV